MNNLPADHELETSLRGLKPDIQVNPAYRVALREKITAEVRPRTHFLTSDLMGKLLYSAAGMAFAVVIAVPTTYYSMDRSDAASAAAALPRLADVVSPELKIQQVPAQAFGKLTVNNAMGKGSQGGGGSPTAAMNANATAPQVAQAPVAATPPAAPAEPTPTAVALDAPVAKRSSIAGGGAEMDRMMIAPYQQTIVKYTVPAGAFDAVGPTVPVLSRVKDQVSSLRPDSALAGQTLFSPAAFQTAQTDMVSFSEKTPFGYQVTVSYTDGTVNINQAPDQWPNEYAACSKPSAIPDSCGPKPLTETDMLSDADSLRIAADFLQKYGITTGSTYAAPEVDKSYQKWISESKVRGETPYYPDQMTVIYPLLINGEKAYYEGSTQPMGLTVSVSVRYKKVTSVYNLSSQQYQQSDYATATKDDLQKYAEAGGQGYYPMPLAASDQSGEAASTKYLQLTLGTPKRVLVSQWLYDAEKSTSRELLVPSLVFPVEGRIEPSEANGYVYIPENITVPLAADVLTSRMPVMTATQAMPPVDVKTMEVVPVTLPASSSSVASPVATPAKG